MGSIKRGLANNIGASGVLGSSAFNNSSLDNITSIGGAGSLTLLSSATASGDSYIDFTGIDSTYSEYWFVWNDYHPSTNGESTLGFQGSTDGGSSFGLTITSTMWTHYNNEADNSYGLIYYNGGDLAQQTDTQILYDGGNGNDSDQNACGILKLYNPSSTTYVKHFQSFGCNYQDSDYINLPYVSGYFNTTSAINAIRFTPGRVYVSTTMDDGHFQMFGVK